MEDVPQGPAEFARIFLRVVVAVAFVGIGISHFVTPEPFVRIMPAVLPFPLALVYISGAAEIAGGAGLLLASSRRVAAWSLMVLLVAVFPANINMAVNEIYFDAMPHQPWLLWARLPMQLVIMAVVYWVGISGASQSHVEGGP